MSYSGIGMRKAAAEGDAELILANLSFGINVNEKDELGYTALHYACRSDRVKMENIVTLLLDHGANVNEQTNSLTVIGQKQITGGATIASQHDHRIAMSFLVLGMVSQQAVSVVNTETIATSFPQFASLMNGAGANIHAPEV